MRGCPLNQCEQIACKFNKKTGSKARFACANSYQIDSELFAVVRRLPGTIEL